MTEPLRVGVAGLGTVGASVIRILSRQHDALTQRAGRPVRVTAVAARERGKDRGLDLSGYAWFDSPGDAGPRGRNRLRRRADGRRGRRGQDTVEAAIAAGKHVVTANKALLARHGLALARAAEARGVALAFEASAAGGIPVVKTLREALPGNVIDRVYGILNGTCNYILSRMEAGGAHLRRMPRRRPAARLRRGRPDLRRRGLRHRPQARDPHQPRLRHRDRRRRDLCRGHLEDHPARPQDGRASSAIASSCSASPSARDTGIEQRVHPTMVPKSPPSRRSMGVTNAVAIDADAVRELTLIGPGAGGDATASAVVADIADVASGQAAPPFGRPVDRLERAERAPMQRHEGGYYIRLTVSDRPGALRRHREPHGRGRHLARKHRPAPLRGRGACGTRTASPARRCRSCSSPTPTDEAALRAALEKIGADGLIAEPPQVIRIERE